MVLKSPPSNLAPPGPPGNSVSPLNNNGDPSMRNEIEPGVWPGLWMACKRKRPTSMTSASSMNTS
ncbi:unannotated protein [freshwater metagenome]|uniref:Unannotated protein n=1 Tax=freshwater metagenome TaxID=449393 RepID=A0A6J6YZM4_9ZZZZ